MNDDDWMKAVVKRLWNLTDSVISAGTTDQAMTLMNTMREQAMRLDAKLADPRHAWNRVKD